MAGVGEEDWGVFGVGRGRPGVAGGGQEKAGKDGVAGGGQGITRGWQG